MKIDVYTDGSATIATKPGGYGWVITVDDVKTDEGFGHIPLATNNDAELEAAIQGLVAVFKFMSTNGLLDRMVDVTLVSDSQIILNWASGAHRFKQVAKMNKYQALRALVQRMKVKTRWVEGHSGDEHNERCDKLANMGRKNQEKEDRKIANPQTKIGNKKDGVTCFWYKGVLKVLDLQQNLVEDYDKELHGKRESKMEIK